MSNYYYCFPEISEALPLPMRAAPGLLNTNSSLNTSPEKLLETQQLWHSLTEGSETTSVPVVTIEPAVFNPPPPALSKIVEGILEKQQQQQPQQQQPEGKRRQTKTCLACGQPKSQYETHGSTVHYFYQRGPVLYFYCSNKMHQTYAAEGISNPKMPFEEFAQTEFFQRDLDATRKRSEERMEKKRKRPETQQTGRLCRFCHMDLKQGPNSPHVHTAFPGVAGKYIYCPSKVH
ncbi:polyamine-modulated factor 1 [Sarotherodon galilaeus]